MPEFPVFGNPEDSGLLLTRTVTKVDHYDELGFRYAVRADGSDDFGDFVDLDG